MYFKLVYSDRCSLAISFYIKLNRSWSDLFLLPNKATVILQLQFSPFKTYFLQF